MGWGTAFATGLVKGFTQNIKEEEAKRLSERERLNKLDELLLTASTKKDANIDAIKSAASLIQSARTEMNNRKPIDIFGTASDEIDVDFAKMQGALVQASQFESKIGGFGFNVDVRSFKNVGDSYAALTDMNSTFFATPEAAAKLLNASEADLTTFQNLYIGHSTRLLNDFKLRKTGDKDVKMDMSVLKGIERFDKIIRMRTGKKDYNSLNIAFSQIEGKPGSVDYSATPTAIVASGIEQNQQGFAFLGQQLRTELEYLPNVWDAFTSQTGGVTREVRQNWFNAARDIANDYVTSGMTFPTKQISLSTMNSEAAGDLLNKIVTKVNGDPIGAAYVYGAFQEIDNWDPDTGFDYVDEAVTNRLIASQELFGRSAKEEDFTKLQQANNEIVDVLGTRGGTTGLYGLRQMVTDDFRGPAVIDKAKGFLASAGAIFVALAGSDKGELTRATISSFVPEADIVSAEEAAARQGQIDPETGEPYKFITEDFAARMNARIETARQMGMANKRSDETFAEAGARYARFEAIRISLAFQMARAADPSGRLSNQDIEAQLVRLGKNMDTPQAMQARIDVAIQDFETKKARYGAIIDAVGDGTGKATVGSKKLIKGIIGIDRLAKKALGGQGSFAQYVEGMGGTQEVATYDPPTGGRPSTNFTSMDGRPVFPATNNGIPVVDPNGMNVYVDVEGRQVEVKAIDRSQPQATADTAPAETPSPAPKTPSQTPAPTAPQGTGTGELPQANIQRNDTPPQTDVVPAPKQGIDPKMVDIISGNGAVGIKLRDKNTGEELPGKYKVVNGRYVQVDGVGA